MQKIYLLLSICALALVGACDYQASQDEPQTQPDEPPAAQQEAPAPTPESAPQGMLLEDPGDAGSPAVSNGIAIMYPTDGNDAEGVIEFSQTDQGVEVKAQMENLPPGRHAYHVHLYGDCSGADGKTAGTHFNFEGSAKNPPEDIDRITGDLGELVAHAEGTATASAEIEKASLQGPYSIIGRSVIVHEKGNDPESPPIGAAGARLACGVIGVAES